MKSLINLSLRGAIATWQSKTVGEDCRAALAMTENIEINSDFLTVEREVTVFNQGIKN